MRRISYASSMLMLLISCTTVPDNKKLTYQNIIILSDLSSRINNLPQKDTAEIHQIVEYFKNECVKPGEKIGDKSAIYFSTFSNDVNTSIDVNQIKNLGEKQRFINSTGEYSKNGLATRIVNLEMFIKKTYETTNNPGLDLISVLVDKIENRSIVKLDTFLTDGVDSTFINYDNHIYIFTDGYLEYRNKEKNSQYYFGDSEIKRMREYCKRGGIDVVKALQDDTSLGVPAVKSIKNRLVNLHVFETHERDFDKKYQTYENPKGLRDNEILEAVWRKWAQESGFKSFEWKKY